MSVAAEAGRHREIAQLAAATDRVLGKHIIDMDQEARDLANAADGKISAHERLCTERWTQSKESSVRLELAMAELKKAVEDRIGKVPATIIAVMSAVIGFLAARAFPMH